MNKAENQSYTKYFLLAISLHCIVLAVILLNHSSQETLKISAMEPTHSMPKEIVASLAVIPSEAPKKIQKKIQIAEPQKLVQDLVKDLVQEQEINLEKIKAEKLAKLEKLEKELEKNKVEQLAKLEQAKREQAKIEAARLLEQNKERILAQKRITQVQQEAEKVAQKAAEQVLAQQQALAQQAQRANEQAQLLRMIDRYALLMRAKIHQNWRRPVGIDNLYKCKVAVKLGIHGEVVSAKVIDSSGNVEFDRSAELAILKSSPLPLPSDEKMRAPFNNFTFTFDPQMV